MLQFLHEECNIPILNCDDFIKKCSTKMLKYAHEKGGDLQNCCIKSAALNNLRSLQYCYENGDVLTLECMKSAFKTIII